ncbi:MAG TPA: CGNR zinc finger domain-containing protein [Galbitalea sp.]
MRQTIPTGQWFNGDFVADQDAHGDAPGSSPQRWWFDSGSLALDFAYAGGFGDGPGSITTPAELGQWLVERFPGVDSEPTDRDLIDGRALQRAVATISKSVSAGGVPAAADVDVVNLFAATPDIPPALAGGSRQAGRSRARVGQTFSAMAREAIEVFGAENAERVRECAADDCHLVFFDESRSNNRRWCSMQRCGNRAKVRAHRSRQG